jgi:hypothetical protein
MFGLMVVAMCTLGVSFVASASAEEPGAFLVDGVLPAAATASITEGELLFESLKTANATFLCSGIFEGTIAAGGELYEVTKVLDLTEKEANSDSIAQIVCTPDVNSVCSKASVSPTNLPWDIDPDLVTETDFLLLSLLNVNGVLPAYFLLCEFLGIDVTELCELLEGTAQLVENLSNDLVFPAGSSPTPDARCGGEPETEESGGLVIDEALQSVSGKVLTISE